MTPPGDQSDPTRAGSDPAADSAPDAPPTRFIWPPKPIDLAQAEAAWRESPQLGSAAQIAEDRSAGGVVSAALEGGSPIPSLSPIPLPTQHPQAFVAPPPPAASIDLQLPRSPWRQIEDTWLGLTTPTLAERIAETGWTPEPSGAACPRCASTLGNEPAAPAGIYTAGCIECREKKLRWTRAVRLAEYDGLIRDVIHEIKFTAWRRLGVEGGRLLGRRLDAELAAAGLPRDQRDRLVLVPVPISFWRRMSRGIDHALAICRGVQIETGGRVVRALGRKHRPSQVSVPSSRRGANVSRSMYLRVGGAGGIAGRWTVVIDDVRTSGATLAEACRALQAGGGQQLGPRLKGATKDGGGDGPIEVWTAVLGVADDGRPASGAR